MFLFAVGVFCVGPREWEGFAGECYVFVGRIAEYLFCCLDSFVFF